ENGGRELHGLTPAEPNRAGRDRDRGGRLCHLDGGRIGKRTHARDDASAPVRLGEHPPARVHPDDGIVRARPGDFRARDHIAVPVPDGRFEPDRVTEGGEGMRFPRERDGRRSPGLRTGGRLVVAAPASAMAGCCRGIALRHAPTYAARCWPVSVERLATSSAGVPWKTIRPPLWPAPDPRSMIQSACAMTAR